MNINKSLKKLQDIMDIISTAYSIGDRPSFVQLRSKIQEIFKDLQNEYDQDFARFKALRSPAEISKRLELLKE